MNPGEAEGTRAEPRADNAWVLRAREASYIGDVLDCYGMAIAEADADDDVVTGFRIRSEALWPACVSGRYEGVMTLFSWCMSHRAEVADDDPAQHTVLWAYKWVAHHMMMSPEFSRPQISSALNDLEYQFVSAEWGRRGPLFLRLREAIELGLRDKVAPRIEAWLAVERDEGADCEACEFNLVTEYCASVGEDERALETAAPLLDGRMSCAEVPGNTYVVLLAPLARLGHTEPLLDTYPQAVAHVNEHAVELNVLAELLRFQVHAHALEAAGETVDAFVHLTQIEPAFTGRALWLHATALYFRACLEHDRAPAGLADLTEQLDVRGDFDTPPVIRAASQEMLNRVDAFAARMDERNGNASFSSLIAFHADFVANGQGLDLERD